LDGVIKDKIIQAYGKALIDQKIIENFNGYWTKNQVFYKKLLKELLELLPQKSVEILLDNFMIQNLKLSP
jgi:hypothetical protein